VASKGIDNVTGEMLCKGNVLQIVSSIPKRANLYRKTGSWNQRWEAKTANNWG